MNKNLSSTKILGVSITTSPKREILEYIFEKIKNGKEKMYIVTPNPEILVFSRKHPQFKTILNNATVSLPDGIGVPMAGRILKKDIIGRITGVDFMEELCREASKRHVIVGFLGGMGNVAEEAAERLSKKYPGLKVGFVGEEWREGKTDLSSKGVLSSRRGPATVLSRIKTGPAAPHPHLQSSDALRAEAGGPPVASPANASQPILNSQLSTLNYIHIDILFVAFGFPKQEEWMHENLPKIDVTMAMGVGGAFDFISEKVPRAPKWVRKIGMEWGFRLVRQPWRAKRQLALPRFVWEIVKERTAKK